MEEQKKKAQAAEPEKKDDLEPCTTPHTAEASRTSQEDEACDDGVK